MKTFQRFVHRIQLFLRLEMEAAKATWVQKTLLDLLGTVQETSGLTVQIAEQST